MTSENRPLTFEEAIGHQVALIRDIEKSIRDSRAMGSDLMVKQYQHLKKQFIEQLNEMLKEQNMLLKMVEEDIA